MALGAFNSLRTLMTRAAPIVSLMDLLLLTPEKKTHTRRRNSKKQTEKMKQ